LPVAHRALGTLPCPISLNHGVNSLGARARQNEAAEVARRVLDAEPELTLSKLGARGRHLWSSEKLAEFLAALRIAGIPD
jgi:hypothetical protein